MTIIATIIVLGVLIFVHELGHFWAAKAVGVEVQRFSIGLGPRVWGFTRGETEYVLSAIPLGGYVKMGGMDDEVMAAIEGGDDAQPREPSDRDFDQKPIWARTVVISAGVIMNFLFAWAAYAAALGFWGDQPPATTRVGQVQAAYLPPGAEGFDAIDPGQRIVSVDGSPVAHWGEVQQALMASGGGTLTVELAEPAETVELRLPGDEARRRQAVGAVSYWIDPQVGPMDPGSPAEKGGLERGDRVLSVDGQAVASWYDFTAIIRERPEERTEIRVERDGRELVRAVTPDAYTETNPATGAERTIGRVGIYAPLQETASVEVGFGEAVGGGWRLTVNTSAMILGFLGDLVTGGVSPRSVGSIVTIGQASGEAAALGMDYFLRFMALFSVNLAILNLLPIPILDGGHLLFLGIEAIRGQALSLEARLKWSNVGFLIVMAIMVWALSNDVLRLFGL